jgi:tetratricopeptide (TPR) repeat protein
VDAKDDIKQLVKATLSDEGLGQWLLIVDNADDDSVLFDPLREGGGTDRLIDYLPYSRKGSIVFTTRTRKAAVKLATSNHIQLSELDETEAKKMLEQHVSNKDLLEEDEVVHEFLELLTYLPLAIVQAVAFMVGNEIRLSEYIAIYRGSERDATELLRKDFEDQGRYRQSKNPVAITWYISFSKIQQQDTLAADYLSLMACTTGEAIPASLLWPGTTKLATIEALGTLSAYAFIVERQHQQSSIDVLCQERIFDMHRLVRLATRSWLQDNGQWQEWASRALRRLVELMPFADHETRQSWSAYLPHATMVIEIPEVFETEDRIMLLSQVGNCELILGRYRAAEQALLQVLRCIEKVLGKEHPDTLIIMNRLGQALSGQGRYTKAEAIDRETLALGEKVLGKEHPTTLSSRNNLALVLNNQKKYIEAEAMHRETLAIFMKVLGKNHPDTLASMINLAAVLSDQDKYAEAEAMLQETLALGEQVLGKEHPSMLMSMNNMATTLFDQKKYVEAEAIYRRTLALQEKVLGKEHPNTLLTMYNLYHTLHFQHQDEKSVPLLNSAYTGYRDTLGHDHPMTRVCLENLKTLEPRAYTHPCGSQHSDTTLQAHGRKRRRVKK